MRMTSKEFELPILNDKVTHYTAHLGFGDYDKIFAFAKWRCPVSYHAHKGGYYDDGIAAVYSDGTTDWMSFCNIRDAIERNWEYFRKVLQEEGGEDLMSEEYGERIKDNVTLTLKCSKMTFKTSVSRAVAFDRIWGRVMYEYAE